MIASSTGPDYPSAANSEPSSFSCETYDGLTGMRPSGIWTPSKKFVSARIQLSPKPHLLAVMTYTEEDTRRARACAGLSVDNIEGGTRDPRDAQHGAEGRCLG